MSERTRDEIRAIVLGVFATMPDPGHRLCGCDACDEARADAIADALTPESEED